MHYENYSVLTTVYLKDKSEYLRESIDSMVNQTVVTNDYVIILDGPVSDEVRKMLEEYSKKYSFFNIYSLAENHGLGYALAYGIEKCKNELIARLDADDLSDKDRCRKQLSLFNENEMLDIVGSFMYEFIDDPAKPISKKIMPVSHKDIFKTGKRKNPFNHSSVMYKKSTVVKCGNYHDMRRGQDIELFTRMLINGAYAYNIPEPLIMYRIEQDQFKRRTNKLSTSNIVGVIWHNHKLGYSNISDVIYAVVREFGGRYCPNFIGKYIYRHTGRIQV